MPNRLLAGAFLLALATTAHAAIGEAPAEPRNAIVKVTDIAEGGHGSGFLIERRAGLDHDLYVTAGHVVAGMLGSIGSHKGLLRLAYGDGTHADTITPGVADFIYDFAILVATETEKSPAKPLALDCGPVPAVGTAVTALGYPLDLPETLTHGYIAAKQAPRGDWPEAVVTDMTIAPGSSGGPVLGPDGRVVGIMVGWLAPTGFSAFVPIKRVCDWLGIKEPAA